MIDKVEVRTPQGTLLTLSLEDVSDGFIINDISGLVPGKASFASSNYATMDGAQYQSSRMEPRNIVLKVDLEPDYVTTSVRGLRTQLYNFFMPKTQVYLRFFMADGLTVDILGYVEFFESALFTDTPSVDISILCFKPDFLAIASTEFAGSTTSSTVETLLTYEGTTPTGFEFTLNVNRSMSGLTLYNRQPDNTIKSMDFSISLVSGDVFTVSTLSGQKSVSLTRSGITTAVLYALSPQSWIELFPGGNYIRAYAPGTAVPYEITYTARYGGL